MALRTELEIGTRVYYPRDKWVGNVVQLDEFPGLELADVRWRTPAPEDAPSCVVSTVAIDSLIVVDETVKSPYKDYKWHEESKKFFQVVMYAVEMLELQKEIDSI
jgi:hypothetical protein